MVPSGSHQAAIQVSSKLQAHLGKRETLLPSPQRPNPVPGSCVTASPYLPTSCGLGIALHNCKPSSGPCPRVISQHLSQHAAWFFKASRRIFLYSLKTECYIMKQNQGPDDLLTFSIKSGWRRSYPIISIGVCKYASTQRDWVYMVQTGGGKKFLGIILEFCLPHKIRTIDSADISLCNFLSENSHSAPLSGLRGFRFVKSFSYKSELLLNNKIY